MPKRLTIAEIKAHALDRVEEIVQSHDICPGGKVAGGIYTPRNPTRNDARPGSFVVYLRGVKRGGFVEYANPSEEKGDIIDLVAYCLEGGTNFKSKAAFQRACDWLARFCGLDFMPDSARGAALERIKRDQSRRESADARMARARQTAFATFEKAQPPEGTLADTYLATRGIALSAIANREADIRYLPDAEWWMGRQRDGADRVVQYGAHFPVMLHAIRDVRGRFVSLHRTYLAPDGKGKAPVSKPKLIFPDYRGGVIRLTRGEGNLSPEEAAAAGLSGPCGITEGTEDGWTLAQAAPGLRVWAAVALSNFCNVPDHDCVSAWLIHRQNDWGKRAAVTAFERGKAHLEETGKPLAELAALGGKDLNETLNG